MKIKKIRLQTQNLDQQILFYTQRLGLKKLVENSTGFTCQAGNSELEFYTGPENDPRPTYHFAFNIPAQQIESARDWLITNGMKLFPFKEQDIIDFPNWNARALYFSDPGGNIVEFIGRRDLKVANPPVFTPGNIMEISEIGFPVPSVKSFYEFLEQSWEIPVYSHISNMTSFCAAGSPRGLFIIVPLQRPWFPTGLVNGIYPTEVWIAGKSREKLTFADTPYTIISNIA